MKKNYNHNIIRIKKGKPNYSQVYWIIVILNKTKLSSQKIIERLGYFKFGNWKQLIINFERLAFFLNKGAILNKTVIHYLYKYIKPVLKKIKIKTNIKVFRRKIKSPLDSDYRKTLKDYCKTLELMFKKKKKLYYLNLIKKYINKNILIKI